MTERPLNVINPDGGGAAAPGYDHGWFEFSPVPTRMPVSWPGGARLAVCVVLSLGAVEWEQTVAGPIRPPGGRGLGPPPDFPRMSHREFGHRVGVFRLLEMADQLQVPLAAAVDLLTARHYPALMNHLVPAVAEIVAAGLSASRPITSQMTAGEERDYIELATQGLACAVGTRAEGWIGPEHSESHRTPRLLAEAGLSYTLDWANDETPYPMAGTGANQPLWSFPLSWELSDLSAMYLRQVSPWAYARSVIDAVSRLCDQGADLGSLLGLHLHPWVSGQAFRADAVRGVLEHIRADQRIWLATPGEVVRWCRDQC